MTNKQNFEERFQKADEEIEKLNSMYHDFSRMYDVFSKEKKKSQHAKWLHDINGKIESYKNNLESRIKIVRRMAITTIAGNAFYLSIRPIATSVGDAVQQPYLIATDLVFLSTLGLPFYFNHLFKKEAKKMENEIKSEIGEDNFKEKIRRIEEKNASVYYR